MFDTSVIMAILNKEPGQDIGKTYLSEALFSVVNYAEAASNLGKKNLPATAMEIALRPFDRIVVPINKEIALLTGALMPETKQYGLSLGDRTCLALGISSNLPVLTADKVWAELDLPIGVRLIR